MKGLHAGGIIRSVKDGKYVYALIYGRASGKWSFPKGHANPGETVEECVKREVYEETGLNVDNLTRVGYCKLSCTKFIIYHSDSILQMNPVDIYEVEMTAWLTVEEISSLPYNKGVKLFLEKVDRIESQYNAFSLPVPLPRSQCGIDSFSSDNLRDQSISSFSILC